MGLFSWLFGSKPFVSERLKFVQKLSEKEEPEISMRKLCRDYHFFLNFYQQKIQVELEYNPTWKSWNFSVWSSEARDFIYSRFDLSFSHSVINYLLDKYNLIPMLEESLERDKKQAKLEKEIINNIKEKLLK